MTERKRASAAKLLISAGAIAATLGGWVALGAQSAASVALPTPPATAETRVVPTATPTLPGAAVDKLPTTRASQPTVEPARPRPTVTAPARARRPAAVAVTRSSR